MRRGLLIALGLTVLVGLAAGCAVQDASGQRLMISRVLVGGDEIRVAGSADLSDGACVNTQLFVGGRPVSWWPSDRCASVEGGSWKLSVPLDESLSPQAQYKVHAWQEGQPSVKAPPFYFDLEGPPTPKGSDEG